MKHMPQHPFDGPPRDLVGQAARAHALAEFVDHVSARGRARFATHLYIARWWQAHLEEFSAPA